MTHDEQKPVREAFEKWRKQQYWHVSNPHPQDREIGKFNHGAWTGWEGRDAIATTRESELLAVIRAMVEAGNKVKTGWVMGELDGDALMENMAQTIPALSESIRLAEQVV